MRALVVYESMFGNTKEIAHAVGNGLSSYLRVDVAEVGTAETNVDDVDLLVVGAPTHAFGLSRPSTRQDAARQGTGAIVSAGQGLREWLTCLTGPAKETFAAAFDTRVAKPRVPGSAAHAAARRLQRAGFRKAAKAQSFYVVGTPGPLVNGELERARHWGDELGRIVTEATIHP